MKIILSGYGTMGKIVEKMALEKGHTIEGVFSIVNIESPYTIFSNVESLPSADIIIDFSHPDNIIALLEGAKQHKIPMVVATTGNRNNVIKAIEDAAKFCPIFFSENMSYGIHVFTKLLEYLVPLLDEFDIEIIEKHHNKKIDSPSGTALKIIDTIISSNDNLHPFYERFTEPHKRELGEIGVSSVRGGTIVGEHSVIFAGNDEVIEITHTAQSKKIFAEGALKVACLLKEKQNGIYSFDTI